MSKDILDLNEEDIKMNEDFYKLLYKKAMMLMMAKIDSGEADEKTVKLIIDEIKRLEIAIQDDDIEMITSFVTSVRSGDNVIEMDLPDPKTMQG